MKTSIPYQKREFYVESKIESTFKQYDMTLKEVIELQRLGNMSRKKVKNKVLDDRK